jgi:hypothetical protein
MMSPSLLERATPAFRRGYNDCLYNRSKLTKSDLAYCVAGTFLHRDYSDGWDARMNEVYWDAQRDNRA